MGLAFYPMFLLFSKEIIEVIVDKSSFNVQLRCHFKIELLCF